MDDNPFVDPSDVNPFEDLSGTKSSNAVLEIDDRTDNPFHNSGTMTQQLDGNISQATKQLRDRQAELDRKDAELAQREARLNNSEVPKVNNWPPLPNFLPIKPCWYHDIDLEIPMQYQDTVRKMYHVWLGYVLVLFVNFGAFLLITFAPSRPFGKEPSTDDQPIISANQVISTNGTERKRRSTDGFAGCNTGTDLYLVWVSLIWLVIFVPCSMLWYRALYKAFKDNSSFQFFLFIYLYYFQMIFHIIQAIGADNMGFGGWLQVFKFLHYCSIFQGLLLLLPALGFSACAVVCIMQMIKVHDIFKSSNNNLRDAQTEWATGMMKNATVRNVAADVGKNVFSNQVGGAFG